MATFSGIFVPSSPVTSGGSQTRYSASVANGATASITLGNRALFAVAMGGNGNIEFGNATKTPTAAATSPPIFAGGIQMYDLGEEFDRISLFNNSGSAQNYWVWTLTRT